MKPLRERGAVIIQVAIAIAVLCGFCALAVDYGVLHAARGQAQHAADAAALAGATALAFDSVFTTSTAQAAAAAVGGAYRVWGEPPIVTVAAEGASCTPPGVPPPPPVPRLLTCITVNVFRDQAHANPLPTYFARAIGVMDQGTRARAVATAVPANVTHCAWPIAVPDRWDENNPVVGPWLTSPPSTFTPGDSYRAPTVASPGSGFSLSTATLNMNISLRLNPANFAVPLEAGQYVAVRIPGTASFAEALSDCGDEPVTIGDTLALDGAGSIGELTTAAGDRRVDDINASWNAVQLRIRSSCATTAPPCAAISPRLVVLPVFDVNAYEATRATGTPTIRIVNFVGFFINTVNPGVAVTGNLATYPGAVNISRPQVGYISAFLRSAVLYR